MSNQIHEILKVNTKIISKIKFWKNLSFFDVNILVITDSNSAARKLKAKNTPPEPKNTTKKHHSYIF